MLLENNNRYTFKNLLHRSIVKIQFFEIVVNSVEFIFIFDGSSLRIKTQKFPSFVAFTPA